MCNSCVRGDGGSLVEGVAISTHLAGQLLVCGSPFCAAARVSPDRSTLLMCTWPHGETGQKAFLHGDRGCMSASFAASAWEIGGLGCYCKGLHLASLGLSCDKTLLCRQTGTSRSPSPHWQQLGLVRKASRGPAAASGLSASSSSHLLPAPLHICAVGGEGKRNQREGLVARGTRAQHLVAKSIRWLPITTPSSISSLLRRPWTRRARAVGLLTRARRPHHQRGRDGA